MDTNRYIEDLRFNFPALNTKVNGYRLAYLDNAATTQKPQQVMDSLNKYYTSSNANVHRGVHFLSESASEAYEQARNKIQKFINAEHSAECIFTRGTTEAINLVATSFGQQFIQAGDEILISLMEHHSNIVPWKLLCERTGAKLSIIPIDQNGDLELDNLAELLKPNTKIVAITHVSNSLGTLNPIKQIISQAHALNIPVLIDGAQAAAHLKIDVQDLDCDFYAMSAHKCFGPMGVGLLYGKKQWLEQMPPYQGGGDMILQVTFDKVTYNELPYKFEAGTPSVADAIAWGAAIDYYLKLDLALLARHEHELYFCALSELQTIPGLKIIGNAKNRIGLISFTLDGIHPHDIGTIANQYGVAIRTGHHCTMPLMNFYNIPGTARASFAFYNNYADIDQLCDSLTKAQQLFNKRA